MTGAVTGVEGEVMGCGGAAAHLFAREGAKSTYITGTDLVIDGGTTAQ